VRLVAGSSGNADDHAAVRTKECPTSKTDLGVLDGRRLDAGEEIGDDAIEQRNIDGRQLSNVHVFHGE